MRARNLWLLALFFLSLQRQEQYRELQLRRQQDNRNDTVIGTEQANAEKND